MNCIKNGQYLESIICTVNNTKSKWNKFSVYAKQKSPLFSILFHGHFFLMYELVAVDRRFCTISPQKFPRVVPKV